MSNQAAQTSIKENYQDLESSCEQSGISLLNALSLLEKLKVIPYLIGSRMSILIY
jgi:hypothetical protein